MLRLWIRLAARAAACAATLPPVLAALGCAGQDARHDRPAAAPAKPDVTAPPAGGLGDALVPVGADASVATTTPRAPSPAAIDPPIGESVRVGGDREVRTEWTGSEFRCGSSRIETPLPEGYPAPTPPGAIEIKRYPTVRRAEVDGALWPELGMNLAFFPLFNHIKRRDIAMTSPVEMDYSGLTAENPQAGAGDWTMSFLYRRVEQGPLGRDDRDERVSVVDRAPLTVVAVGLRGGYGLGRTREGLAQLGAWLDENPQWAPAGPTRVMHYNGPDTRDRDKWMEVQAPIRPATTP